MGSISKIQKDGISLRMLYSWLIVIAVIIFLYFRSQIRATTMRILRIEGEVTLEDNGKPKSNILQDVEVSGCVFYDCQKGGLITDQNRNLTWDESVRWKINVHHNTFVNFCTTNKQVIMNSRYNPGRRDHRPHEGKNQNS